MVRWVIRKSDGAFLRGGGVQELEIDEATEEAVDVDLRVPEEGDPPEMIYPEFVDPRIHRWDFQNKRLRLRTPAEETAEEVAHIDRLFEDPNSIRLMVALARAVWEQLPAGKPAWLVFKARVKTLYVGFDQIP